MKCLNFPTGISDAITLFQLLLTSNIAIDEMSKFEYRGFRKFDQEKFLLDLQGIDFSFARTAERDADTAYELFETHILDVVNKRRPTTGRRNSLA